MAGILVKRDQTGTHLRLQGCCGNFERDRRMYEQALFEQLLREGGRITSRSADHLEVVDRKGRTHRLGASACDHPAP